MSTSNGVGEHRIGDLDDADRLVILDDLGRLHSLAPSDRR
jgi:hypothetical protein